MSTGPPTGWERLGEAFLPILESSGAERRRLLGVLGQEDPALRDEVVSLLDAHDRTHLEAVSESLGLLAADFHPHALPGKGTPDRIGAYRVLRRLGSGGMGVVYLGERADVDYEQRVAVKVVHPGVDPDLVRQRFTAERRILARLEHPGISRFVDAGFTDGGDPFIVMEYVDGTPLVDYCDGRRMSLGDRIRLFVRIAQAVAYAHSRLVIHRDIKPSNVLVTQLGEPKLLDFGVAKILDPAVETEATRPGGRWMTPEFASPEELAGEPVTTASDVYSLSAVLYELLTGQRPHRQEGMNLRDFERRILTVDPEAPSRAVLAGNALESDGGEFARTERALARGAKPARLSRHLKGDLDLIVLKGLRKDPARRYATAGELVLDLERHLASQPVGARPETAPYRVRKFVRRNRGAVLATSAVVLALALGLVAAASQAARARTLAMVAEQERDRARLQAGRAEEASALLIELFRLSDPEATADSVTAVALLEEGELRIRTNLGDQPELRADFLTELARIHRNLGSYGRAAALVEEVAADANRLGLEGAGTRAQALLGLLMHDQGDPIGAAEELAAAAAAYGRLGDSSAQGVVLTDLGFAQMAQAGHETAQVTFAQAIELLRDAPDADTADVAEALYGLATSHHDGTRFGSADSLLQASVDLYRLSAVSDPNLARALQRLGLVRQFSGRVQEAEALHREALEIRERFFSDTHPEVLGSVADLGFLLQNAGLAREARPLLERTLRGMAVSLGVDHPNYSAMQGSYAANLRSLGRYDAAAALFSQVVDYTRTNLGHDHPFLPLLVFHVADSELRQGRYSVGLERAREGERVAREIHGPDHPHLAMNLWGQSRALRALGSTAMADELLGQAISIAEAALDRSHPIVVDMLATQAEVLSATDVPGAIQRLRDILSLHQQRGHPDDYRRGERLTLLGELLMSRGEHARAQEALVEARRILAVSLGSNDPRAEKADRLLADLGGRPGMQ